MAGPSPASGCWGVGGRPQPSPPLRWVVSRIRDAVCAAAHVLSRPMSARAVQTHESCHCPFPTPNPQDSPAPLQIEASPLPMAQSKGPASLSSLNSWSSSLTHHVPATLNLGAFACVRSHPRTLHLAFCKTSPHLPGFSLGRSSLTALLVRRPSSTRLCCRLNSLFLSSHPGHGVIMHETSLCVLAVLPHRTVHFMKSRTRSALSRCPRHLG